MIGYVTLGTNNYDEAARFYDDLFAVLGAARLIESDRFIAWGTGMTSPAVSIAKPYDGNPVLCRLFQGSRRQQAQCVLHDRWLIRRQSLRRSSA